MSRAIAKSTRPFLKAVINGRYTQATHFHTTHSTMAKLVVGMMGSSPHSGSSSLSTPEQYNAYLDVVASHNIHELDTARIYGSGACETVLGEIDASSRFTISTKAPGFSPGSLTHDKIVSNSKLSHEALKQDQVDIYYIHGPDRQTPFEEQAKAFNELYQQGKFKRFGVCNISAEEVQQMHDICEKNGWVKPSVYQGGYNIAMRNSEFKLFPTLRKLGMKFYGFGPLAHGLLTKSIEEIQNPAPGSHFAEIPFLKAMYLKEKNLVALKQFGETCEKAGLSRMAVALRWELHHSPLGEGDAVLVGAGSKAHIDASLKAAEGGPLPDDMIKAVEALWEAIKDDDVPYHV